VESLRAEDPDQVAGYALLARLGRGAMGTVYLGRSPGGRLVAVKVVRAELADDPGFRERFRQEVATARAVGGFWTAAVVDADPAAPRPWLATEYVPGPTLHDAVAAHGPLPEPAVRRLVAGLAEALLAIHGAGAVHRDLKPSNVLLAADGPRVIDFGIAKALEQASLTATGFLIGTPGYLSPEQIEGREVTPASDVFALGSVLVYAATGRGPYGSGDAAALAYRAVHTAPDLGGVPAGLRALAARCLDGRPGARPTPADLLAEIGPPGTEQWLPEPVRTAVEECRTQALHPPPPRQRTKQYTVLAPGLPPTLAAPSAAPRPPAGPPPGGPPGAPPQAGPVPGAPPRGSRAVFRISRVTASVWGSLAAAGALTCGSISQGASKAGNPGGSFLFFVGFVLLAIPAVRLLRVLFHQRRWVEISAAGITAVRGATRRELPWSQLARVRLVEHGRRPWLMVWPTNPQAARAALGGEYREEYGGFRLFPVGHERRRAAREREIRELRAALGWYGRAAYDPSADGAVPWSPHRPPPR
jgi:hypothetical protein